MITHLVKISFKIIVILIFGPIVVKSFCMLFIPRPVRKLVKGTCRFAIKVVRYFSLASIPVLKCIWKNLAIVSKKSLSLYKSSNKSGVTKIEHNKKNTDNVVDIDSKRKAK